MTAGSIHGIDMGVQTSPTVGPGEAAGLSEHGRSLAGRYDPPGCAGSVVEREAGPMDRDIVSRSLEDLVRSYELSSYRESLFAQLFVAELLQGCWIAGLKPVEIDRPAVDFQGYDLVATCAGVVRHTLL